MSRLYYRIPIQLFPALPINRIACVQAGWMEGVAGLVKGGEEVDAVELLAGRTPLHLALELGNPAYYELKFFKGSVCILNLRLYTSR